MATLLVEESVRDRALEKKHTPRIPYNLEHLVILDDILLHNMVKQKE